MHTPPLGHCQLHLDYCGYFLLLQLAPAPGNLLNYHRLGRVMSIKQFHIFLIIHVLCGKICIRWGCILNAIIPACFLTFCCSAIPTPPYIYNVFYTCNYTGSLAPPLPQVPCSRFGYTVISVRPSSYDHLLH